jgi:PhzF family phenazine biosynthesis protein
MTIDIFHIDTFTSILFKGNPSAVCILSAWVKETDLQAVAKENNQPVTAFLVCKSDGFEIRWFTPEFELDICGHGSLAAAYVIFKFIKPDLKDIELKSPLENISISRSGDLITLSLSVKKIESCSFPPAPGMLQTLPKEIYKNDDRCMMVFNNEHEIVNIKVNVASFKNFKYRALVVTAPGNNVDFVSRTFYPSKLIIEDFVTGVSHCMLAPYWSARLKKQKMHALQLSDRGGELFCEVKNQQVLISGKAVLYAKGSIFI